MPDAFHQRMQEHDLPRLSQHFTGQYTVTEVSPPEVRELPQRTAHSEYTDSTNSTIQMVSSRFRFTLRFTHFQTTARGFAIIC